MGPIEAAVLSEVGDAGSALAQTAIALARFLDGGAGMATAAVSKELRATLAEVKFNNQKDDAPDVVDQLRANAPRWEHATAG
jgi:hypothetical protein